MRRRALERMREAVVETPMLVAYAAAVGTIALVLQIVEWFA